MLRGVQLSNGVNRLVMCTIVQTLTDCLSCKGHERLPAFRSDEGVEQCGVV